MEFALDISPDVDRIAGNAEAIREILGSLLVVALQALPDGGRIAIKGRNVKVQSAGPAGLEPGHYVRLTFRDERRGLNPALWRSLVHGEPPRESSAGGLASVLALVTEERGWLTVQAEPEQGALFTLYLRATALGLAPAPEEPSEELGSGFRAS